MDIGEPLRTIIEEPLELPVNEPAVEPVPEPQEPQSEPVPANIERLREWNNSTHMVIR